MLTANSLPFIVTFSAQLLMFICFERLRWLVLLHPNECDWIPRLKRSLKRVREPHFSVPTTRERHPGVVTLALIATSISTRFQLLKLPNFVCGADPSASFSAQRGLHRFAAYKYSTPHCHSYLYKVIREYAMYIIQICGSTEYFGHIK